MDTLRAAVLIACGAGIISCIIGSISVGGSKKAILRLMINCVVLISLLSPFAGIDAEDTVNLIENWDASELGSEDAEQMLRSYDLRAAELSLKLELEKLLESNGINFTDAVISCNIDEYDVITIGRAEVTVKSKEDADKLKTLAAEQMKDLPLTVVTEEQ